MTEQPHNIEVKNPYKAGTKRFLIAERILRGETDNAKIASEIGADVHTVYNVRSELKKIYPKEPTPTPSPTSSTSPAHQKPPEQPSTVSSPSESTPKSNIKSELTGDSLKLTSELVDEIVRKVTDILRKEQSPPSPSTPKTEKLPEGVSPIGEEVEVVGEKVNYKVALNPEIFHFYNLFKAEVERRGRKWDGDFSDFLYMAAKDVLTVHGIHPAVVTLSRGNLLLRLPLKVEEED